MRSWNKEEANRLWRGRKARRLGLRPDDKRIGNRVNDPELIVTEVPKNQAQYTDKQIAYKALRETGYKPQEASKALGYTRTYGYHLDKRLQKFDIKGNKKLLKGANQALKHIINGETFGEVKQIKDSTVLAAVGMVYDRHEPVIKQSLNLNLNADISPVDLSKYMTMTSVNDTPDKGK